MQRHDAVTRALHHHVRDCLGLPSLLEQHTQPAHHEHEYDRIDIVVAISGSDTHVDVAVVTPLSRQQDLLTTRGRHDGHAASKAAARKRARYPHIGVLPFVIEDFGRPGKDALGFVRTLAAMDLERTPSEAATHLWQVLQAIVQGHTAQLLRHAESHRAA